MLSGIIITKNEQQVIRDCVISLGFCNEIIVVDTGNTDETNKIVKEYGARIIKSSGSDYSKFRNDGLAATKGEWVLYLDADERITPLLKIEIEKIIKEETSFSAFEIPRRNIYLAREMHHGGWGNDAVIRLFKKSKLLMYVNPLHEQPKVDGPIGRLQNNMVHFSHRGLYSMLNKTFGFTAYESDLRFKSDHPQIVVWRLVRVMLTEFWKRMVKQKAFLDGTEGIIDAIFQMFNSFVIYVRLWERQNKIA